jgi:hypothetical protein
VKRVISKPDGGDATSTERVEAVRVSVFPEPDQLPIGKRPGPSTSLERGVTQGEMFLKMIFMKLANDCYQVLGEGIVITPESCLSEESTIDSATPLVSSSVPITESSSASASTDPYGIQSLKLKFNPINGYRDFRDAKTKDKDGGELSFIDFIRTYHRPPETLITPEGTSVPLKGIVGFLALARVLADIDPIGKIGKNAGFVWVTDEGGQIIAAQTAQAAQSTQTAQTAVIRSQRFFHFRIGTNLAFDAYEKFKSQSVRSHQIRNHSIKNLQIDEDDSLKISWNKLSGKQREEFLQVLIQINRFFKSSEIRNYLFERDGTLYPREMADSLKEQVVFLKGRVAAWLDDQLTIYGEELSELETKYLVPIKMARKIDKIGQLPPDQAEKVKKMMRKSILFKLELEKSRQEVAEVQANLKDTQQSFEETVNKLLMKADALQAEKEARQALQERLIHLEEHGSDTLKAEIRQITEKPSRRNSKTGIFRKSLRMKPPSSEGGE